MSEPVIDQPDFVIIDASGIPGPAGPTGPPGPAGMGVLVLQADEPVPEDTPAGTVIVRPS